MRKKNAIFRRINTIDVLKSSVGSKLGAVEKEVASRRCQCKSPRWSEQKDGSSRLPNELGARAKAKSMVQGKSVL